MRLRIADIGISLGSAEAALLPPAAGAMARFADAAAPGADDVVVDVRRADHIEEPADTPPVFDSGSLWRLHRRGDDHVFSFRSDALGGAYKLATFDESFTRGTVVMRSDLGGVTSPIEYPLDELLVTHLLGRGRGAELHACGVATTGGEGLLFVGHSGAGKTTMARLWEDAARGGRSRGTVISDDRVILRPVEGGFSMYGTPWHGDAELSAAASVPLLRILFLARGPTHAIRPLAVAEAVARLYATSFLPLYDAACVAYTLKLFEAIARTVPCEELRFSPDASVVDYIEGHA